MASAPHSSSQPARDGGRGGPPAPPRAETKAEAGGPRAGRRALHPGAAGEAPRGQPSPTRRVWLGLALGVYLAWLGFLAWLAWRSTGEAPRPRPATLAPAPAARENRAP